jgi:hypothetical protein
MLPLDYYLPRYHHPRSDRAACDTIAARIGHLPSDLGVT